MSEKHPKLKLKRKKPSIQDSKSEQNASIFLKKSNEVQIQFTTPCETRGSSFNLKPTRDLHDNSTDGWWDKPSLLDVEKLWAATLKSAIPYLGQGVWETVPDLPLASPMRCPEEEPTRWRWCSLSEEVGPFPPPPKPSAGPSALHAPRPGSQQHPTDPDPVLGEVETLTKCSPQKCDPGPKKVQLGEQSERTGVGDTGPVSRHQGEEEGQQRGAGGEGRGVRADWPCSSASGAREGNAAAVGRSSLEGAGGGGAEGGVIKRQLPAHAGDRSDSCTPAQDAGRRQSPAEEGNVSGNTGGTMESCPMCLLPFPAGFTQMDCDGHLAKCLSEMNEDVTW